MSGLLVAYMHINYAIQPKAGNRKICEKTCKFSILIKLAQEEKSCLISPDRKAAGSNPVECMKKALNFQGFLFCVPHLLLRVWKTSASKNIVAFHMARAPRYDGFAIMAGLW